MPIINPTLPSDGDDAVVAPYNAAIIAILGLLNGGLDTDNISTFDGSKVADRSLTDIKLAPDVLLGWHSSVAPNTVVANGNRSYTLTFNSNDLTDEMSPGQRLRFTRGSTAPSKSTSLNGSTQFYNKTSPNKSAFTDDFAASAWIKLAAYPGAGTDGAIISRYNSTSGWGLIISASGVIKMFGANAGASNFGQVISQQSVPLNRWVHVAAQIDMSSGSLGPTLNYVMIDGVDVPTLFSRGGTNPTAILQAGNLEVGSYNGGASSTINGKLAQVAYYTAKVTQAAIIATMSQGLVGTESNLGSAYSFNNSILDLNTTTPNDLTAQGTAVATNSDSPFNQGGGTYEYGIITSISLGGGNTTMGVQVPEGSALPTSGTISAMQYSNAEIPYGFPASLSKFALSAFDTLGAITYPLVKLIAQYITNQPISHLIFLNPGSAGGSMALTVNGNNWVLVGAGTGSATLDIVVTFPITYGIVPVVIPQTTSAGSFNTVTIGLGPSTTSSSFRTMDFGAAKRAENFSYIVSGYID